MSTKRPTKRKRGTGPLIIGEIDTAELVTPKTVYETKKDGKVVAKQVWQSLDTPISDTEAQNKKADLPSMDDAPSFDSQFDYSSVPEPLQTNQVGILNYD